MERSILSALSLMPDKPFAPSRERLVLSIVERPHSLLLLPRGQETRFSLFSTANRGNFLRGHRHLSFIEMLPRRIRCDVRSRSIDFVKTMRHTSLRSIFHWFLLYYSREILFLVTDCLLFTDTLYICSPEFSINGSVVRTLNRYWTEFYRIACNFWKYTETKKASVNQIYAAIMLLSLSRRSTLMRNYRRKIEALLLSTNVDFSCVCIVSYVCFYFSKTLKKILQK